MTRSKRRRARSSGDMRLISGAGASETWPLPPPDPPPRSPPLRINTVSRAPIAAPATPQGKPTCQPAAWEVGEGGGEGAARAPHLWQNLAVAASAVPQLGQSIEWDNLTGRIAARSIS